MRGATHNAALLSAADDGDLEAVKRFFTQPDVLENVANCNALHRRIRLGEPSAMDGFVPWYSAGWQHSNWISSSILPRGHVDVFRWFFAREQRELFEETLRGVTKAILKSCVSTEACSAAREMVEIVLESPLFNETMDEQERRDVLEYVMAFATQGGCNKWLGMLLAYGADPNCKRDNEAPVTVLGYVGDTKTLEVLLAHGACIEGRRLRIRHPQHKLLVGDLLRSGADANVVQPNQKALLHQAARHRLRHIAQLLIKEGFADVDARDRRGRTPLMVAAAARLLPFGLPPTQEIAQLLLDAGADLHAVDANLRGVLHHVVNNKQRDAYHHDVGVWSPNCLRLFLERGANPNLQDDHGRTPLTILVKQARSNIHGNIKKMLTLLLQAGADPFIRDKRGKCVAHKLRRTKTGIDFMRENPVFFPGAIRPAVGSLPLMSTRATS